MKTVSVVKRNLVPCDANFICSHVLYKVNIQHDASLKLRARIVQHGNEHSDKHIVRSDYCICSPLGIPVIATVSTYKKWCFVCIDLKTTFLQTDPAARSVCVIQPGRFRRRDELWLLLAAEYGLVHAKAMQIGFGNHIYWPCPVLCPPKIIHAHKQERNGWPSRHQDCRWHALHWHRWMPKMVHHVVCQHLEARRSGFTTSNTTLLRSKYNSRWIVPLQYRWWWKAQCHRTLSSFPYPLPTVRWRAKCHRTNRVYVHQCHYGLARHHFITIVLILLQPSQEEVARCSRPRAYVWSLDAETTQAPWNA